VVTRHGVPTSVVYPQKRQYWVQRQVTTEAAIECTTAATSSSRWVTSSEPEMERPVPDSATREFPVAGRFIMA